MPALKDTEWRVLCVIVRQTLGWKVGEGRERKRTDWITRRQLKAKTHRHSEAISDAVDGLVCRRLVEVSDAAGHRLLTRHERRRNGRRLYYRLADAVMATLPKTKDPFSEIEHGFLKSEQGGVRKANTTKETLTKYTPYGGERDAARSPIEGKESLKRKPLPEPPNPDVKRFIRAYIEIFKCHTPSGDPPPIFWGKDGKLVKHLLKVYSYDRLVDLLNQFFQSDDEWIKKLPCSLGAFKAAIPKLLVAEKQVAVIERRDEVTGQWVKVREERL